MNDYEVYNVLDLVDFSGEEEVQNILSDFYCPKNQEIEKFTKKNALEFSKKKMAMTYAVLDYDSVQAKVNELMGKSTTGKTVDELAREVIQGLWGNGAERKSRLTAVGYDYSVVQSRVNQIMKK